MKKTGVLIGFLFVMANGLAQDTTRLSLLFFGDIMQHDSQITDAYNARTKTYNYDPCFQFIKPYIQSADLAIGNLELTLAGPPYKGYPNFSAPDELLVSLKDMGTDVLVTANNHCVDTGKKGLERTIQMLDSLNIPHTGTFVDEVSKLNDHPLLVQKNGFNLALLNYTFSTNGLPVASPNIVNRIDTAAIGKDLRKAKAMKPDAIIVFVHWGAEYQSFPSKWQKDVGEYCFKKGAHLVIGAHPHVLQPMEWRKEKNQLIAYSLGNFVSGQRKRYTDGGGMIKVELEKVVFGDSTSLTGIDTASYMLQWVYRTADAQKNYYLLPVQKFENDSAGFIKDAASREAFKTFIADSRSLYRKHNVNIPEAVFVPSDSVVTYGVWFVTIKDPQSSWKLFPPVPYGHQTEKDENGNIMCFSGSFFRKRDAEKYKEKLMKDFGYNDAVVVEFVNDKRKK
jgi:poly-gamma-glutamate capsule biosynthesis protein CapA/YwtB (metallophosphatase superfamily)